MASPLTRLQARIAGQLARERMGERFAAQVNYEATPVAGLGLARVDGQLVDSTMGEEKSVGDLVAMANVGRPAAAIYSPQGGAAVVLAAAATSETGGGGVTVHAQLSGLGADDHTHYLNIERGDARYYTEPEEDAWRAAHIALADVHHNHATAAAPLSIDNTQYISLLYNTTLVKDAGSKLGVNPAHWFIWQNSHEWVEGQGISSEGDVIVPGLTPGRGWGIDNPVGGNATLTIPNIWVGNLHAQTFIFDTARVDIGEEIWTRSRATLAADFTVPSVIDVSTTATPTPGSFAPLVVEVPPGLPAGVPLFGDMHYVRLRVFDSGRGLTIADAWGVVVFASYVDAVPADEGVRGEPAKQTFTFRMRNGSMGAKILAGALAMGYGLHGDSFVLLTVLKPGAPYTGYYAWGYNGSGQIDTNTRPWDTGSWKLLARVGNLEGQQGTAFGTLHGAGLYADNVYLRGQIQIAAGSDVPWSEVSGSGRPEDNATYGSTWAQVSGEGKPQDNATYGSPWNLVTGDGKPQDNATKGATWNVDMIPPNYLKAPPNGAAAGLYMNGTQLGFWDGDVWNTYLDSGGNFYFSSAPETPVEGDTQLAFFAGKTMVVNEQTVRIPSRLAGKKYTLAIRDQYNNPIAAEDGTFWHKTWWADVDTGALHAGPNGEVMLHNWGLSMIAYHGNDITPSNNVKALSFFDDTDSAIANVERARARIWAGRDMDPEAAGSTYIVTSMLQLEVGGGASGYVDTDDRPRLALFDYSHMTDGRVLEASEWDEIHLYTNHGTQGGIIRLSSGIVSVDGDLWTRSVMPSGGTKAIGAGNNRFDAVYARTIYADSVVAPQFTGMNTVGVELVNTNYTIDAHGNEHVWGESAGTYWTVAHADNGQAFFNPADQQHISVDQTGWYRVSYTIAFYQHDHSVFVRVFASNGAAAYDTLHGMSTNGRVSASGDMYLYAGQKISLIVIGPVGIEPGNYGRFVMIRSGTNGMPSVQNWDSDGNAHIRSASATAAQLVVESTNVGGVMDLRVTGQITTGSGLVDGVNVHQLFTEWNAHKAGADIDDTLQHRNQGPHPQYLLRAEVGSLVATHQYVNEMVASVSEGGVTSGENIPHSTLLGLNQGDDHPQYVSNALARTITARHTFNPAVISAPFLLGTNALGQLVTGLNAEYVGGHTWDDIAMTPAEVLTALLQVDGPGSQIDADLLDGLHGTDYAKSAIIIGAGNGLSGGGSLAASISLAVVAGDGIEVASDAVSLAASVAGAGLTYNTGVLAVGAGDGISVAADVVSLASSAAGAGLTYDTGVLAVGQGFGITVAADAVAVDVTAGYTWTGSHIFQSTITARHIAPEATDTYDLGTSVYWWRQQYVSQINATIFAESTVQLMGGWFMVPKWAGTLPAVASGATQIDLGPNAAPNVVNNDVLLIRAHDASGNIKVEYIKILSLASGTTYNVQRDLAGTHGTDPTWADGTPFALLGQAGDGRIEFNAYDTPRISLIKQGAAYNVQTEIIRIGDINGLGGLTQQTWGIFIGDANQYLKYDGTTLSLKGNGSGLTSIDGGSITTGAISAARITAVSLAAVQANIDRLSTLRADLGDVTAGSIVVGDLTNKLWLNDGGDHGLAIGGLTKANAPFKVAADGTFQATKATLTGTLYTDDGVTEINAGITFRLPAAGVGNGFIQWLIGGSAAHFVQGEGASAAGSTLTHGMYANGYGTPAFAGRSSYLNLYNHASTTTAQAKEALIRIRSDTVNTTTSLTETAYVYLRTTQAASSIEMIADTFTFNSQTVWHAGNFTPGNYAALASPNFSGTPTISSNAIVHRGYVGAAGNWWDRLAWIDSAGVLEAGRYIDFHNADTGNEDYSIRLQTDGGTSNLSINGYGIWHAGNFTPGNYAPLASPNFSGTPKIGGNNILYNAGSFGSLIITTFYSQDYRHDGAFYFRNAAASAWQTMNTGIIYANGDVQSTTYLKTANGNGSMTLGPQNSGWCHMSTDRAAFYFDHTVCVNGNLFNYNGDFTLGRGTNGAMTNRMTFYTWGTYVNQNLTIEDVFAMVNTQSVVNNPASGVKLYVIVSGGVYYLQAKFSNGATRNLANS